MYISISIEVDRWREYRDGARELLVVVTCNFSEPNNTRSCFARFLFCNPEQRQLKEKKKEKNKIKYINVRTYSCTFLSYVFIFPSCYVSFFYFILFYLYFFFTSFCSSSFSLFLFVFFPIFILWVVYPIQVYLNWTIFPYMLPHARAYKFLWTALTCSCSRSLSLPSLLYIGRWRSIVLHLPIRRMHGVDFSPFFFLGELRVATAGASGIAAEKESSRDDVLAFIGAAARKGEPPGPLLLCRAM